MRRIVRDYVVAALHRQQSDIERFVASNLEVPDGFPFVCHEPAVTVREFGRVTIAARTEGDFAEVEVVSAGHFRSGGLATV